jgi:hypothetical protein
MDERRAPLLGGGGKCPGEPMPAMWSVPLLLPKDFNTFLFIL